MSVTIKVVQFSLGTCLVLVLSCGQSSSVPRDFCESLRDARLEGQCLNLKSELSPLGHYDAGTVLRITVLPRQEGQVYVLGPDPRGRTDVSVILDGGPVGSAFLHRVMQSTDLQLFYASPAARSSAVIVELSTADVRKPTSQAIVVVFESDFLLKGLYDPSTDGEDLARLLQDVDAIVQGEVLAGLRRVFEDPCVFPGKPVKILDAPSPDSPVYSTLWYSGAQRIGEGIDVLQTGSSNSASCPDQLIFGEALPRDIDAGNQDPQDMAFVYVGSFRPSETLGCPKSLVLNSVNNIINALTTAGAHEIGHLLGLPHAAVLGIMSPSPVLGIQRELYFERATVLVGTPAGLSGFTADPFVRPRVIQDPAVYFGSIFPNSEVAIPSDVCERRSLGEGG